MMEGIKEIPQSVINLIPVFEGNTRQLPVYIKKCEYVISLYSGSPVQDRYLYEVLTSRLTGQAAILIAEQEGIATWDELKVSLSKHFGDHRNEHGLKLALEGLIIKRDESYLEFCQRIQHHLGILLAKVTETVADPGARRSKSELYHQLAFDTFTYNLPQRFVELIHDKGVNRLEDALRVVLERQNLQNVYNLKCPFRNHGHNRQTSNAEPRNRQDNNSNNHNLIRQSNNPNLSNSSLQYRNNRSQYNNSFNTRNQSHQVSGSAQTRSQQSPVSAPYRPDVTSRNVTSGANTDVTMRTVSARRVNYTENNDADHTYFEPNQEPTPGPSNDQTEAENFFIMASTIGTE